MSENTGAAWRPNRLARTTIGEVSLDEVIKRGAAAERTAVRDAKLKETNETIGCFFQVTLMIVIYEGENDIHNGRTPEQLAADVAAFMDMKTATLGETPIYFVSLKVSKLRWAQRPEQIRANAMIEAMAAERSDLAFIDVTQAMLGPDGLPRDIYVEDQLHMTANGYAIWIPILSAALDAPAESEAEGC